jgi:hypothetical protein
MNERDGIKKQIGMSGKIGIYTSREEARHDRAKEGGGRRSNDSRAWNK